MKLKHLHKFGLAAAIGSVLLALTGSAFAQAIKPDFDQGIDVPKVNGFLSPIPVAAKRMPILSRALGKSVVSGPGYLFGPWQPKILGNEDYKKAQDYPSLIELLLPPVRDPLKANWHDIETVRGDLLANAANLEPVDRQLYQDGVNLDNDAVGLNKQRDDLNAEVAQYNSQCAGKPSNPTCDNWRTDLLRRMGILQGLINQHNDNFAAWKTKVDELQSEGTTLDGKIISWGASIGAFILNAENALENNGITTVRVQAQGDDMPGGGKSRVVSVAGPMCVEMGEQLLAELKSILTNSELKQRGEALGAAANWMRSAAASGGILGPAPSKSFYNSNPDPKNARIDVEVKRGRAFVNCPVGMSGDKILR